jgi:hypothetical protein
MEGQKSPSTSVMSAGQALVVEASSRADETSAVMSDKVGSSVTTASGFVCPDAPASAMSGLPSGLRPQEIRAIGPTQRLKKTARIPVFDRLLTNQLARHTLAGAARGK